MLQSAEPTCPQEKHEWLHIRLGMLGAEVHLRPYEGWNSHNVQQYLCRWTSGDSFFQTLAGIQIHFFLHFILNWDESLTISHIFWENYWNVLISHQIQSTSYGWLVKDAYGRAKELDKFPEFFPSELQTQGGCQRMLLS